MRNIMKRTLILLLALGFGLGCGDDLRPHEHAHSFLGGGGLSGGGLAGGGLGGGDTVAVTHTVKILMTWRGQSNGLGLCTSNNVTVYSPMPTNASPYSRVKIYDDNSKTLADPPTYVVEGWRDLQPRTTLSGGLYTSGMGGSELTAARDLDIRLNGPSIFVLKRAIDGSSLITNWDANFPTGGPPYLIKGASPQVQAEITTQAAAQGITLGNGDNLIDVYDQGEADAGQTYATYLAALQDMDTTLRATWPNSYFHIPRITNEKDVAGQVLAAQECFIAGRSRGSISYHDDLATRDGTHFTDDSYATRGVREAQAIGDSYLGVTPTSPYWLCQGPSVLASSAQGFQATADGTHVALVMPTHATNDILLFWVSGNGNVAITDPVGWTAVTGSPQHNGASGANARLSVWWKRAASGAETAPTANDVASDGNKLGGVAVIHGAKTSGNFFVTSAGSTATTSTSVSWPTVDTTATANALIVNVAAYVGPASTVRQGSAFANSSLTGVTQHINRNSASTPGILLVVGRKATGGVVSATTATLATTADQALLTIAASP
jgi:hypothetical protein